MKILALIITFSLFWSLGSGFAQQRHQLVLWPAMGLQLGSKKLPFRAEFTLQSRFTTWPSRFGAGIGTAHLHYRANIGGLSLAAGYATALVHKLSHVQLLQAYLYYQWEKKKADPVLRLTYDYLWFRPLQGREGTLTNNLRVRLLAGISPPLGKQYRLLFTAEPFLYSGQLLLSEHRMQAGIRRKISQNLALAMVYFILWQKPSLQVPAHRWEHALNLVAQYSFDVAYLHPFHGR